MSQKNQPSEPTPSLPEPSETRTVNGVEYPVVELDLVKTPDVHVNGVGSFVDPTDQDWIRSVELRNR